MEKNLLNGKMKRAGFLAAVAVIMIGGAKSKKTTESISGHAGFLLKRVKSLPLTSTEGTMVYFDGKLCVRRSGAWKYLEISS